MLLTRKQIIAAIKSEANKGLRAIERGKKKGTYEDYSTDPGRAYGRPKRNKKSAKKSGLEGGDLREMDSKGPEVEREGAGSV